ncbi:MAG: SDR family oxidoreductase, partial [Pseudomonadota bacterium]
MTLSIVHALQGKEILLTGATGFLGLALVEKLLRHVPGCSLTLLVRSSDHASAQKRFTELAQAEPIFAGIDATAFARVRCLAGDITVPRLGLNDEDRAALQGRIALVIHSAASVDFDEPIDEAISVNIEGPLAVQALACEIDAGFLQISTAYVCGDRSGPIPDTLDSAGVVAAVDPAVGLQVLRDLVAQLYAEHGYVAGTARKPSKKLILALMTTG